MKTTTSVLILATSLAVVTSLSIFDRNLETSLLSYMARSNSLLQQDPTRSLSCFNKYIPLINEIAENYETSFKACLNESEAASAKADEATLEQRNDLSSAADASCALLNQCQDNSLVEDIFQCYIDGGSVSVQSMYIINANASQELAALREQYYLIRNNEYKCTNETKRSYEKQSAEAYAGLNNCILGNSDQETTQQPTTAAQFTTNTPSEATPTEPQTITTTLQPETTEAPSEETTSKSPLPETTRAEVTEAPEYTTRASESETTEANPIISTIKPETTEQQQDDESTSENPHESTASEINETTESALEE